MFIHIDMDYFFAQVEEKRHPEYKGKVIVVCVYSKRTGDAGVVSTVNYEGRKYGIHSGTPIFQAKSKAPPDSVFVPVDHSHYTQVSKEIGEIVRKYGNTEQTSIDEWFLEVNEIPEETARAIKSEIFEKKGLTCSIGVAPSMLGAKMATDRSKPNGLMVLDKQKETESIGNSEVQKVVGIGKKTAEVLQDMGVQRVKDLKRLDPVALVEKFGKKTGAWLVALAEGRYSDMLRRGEEEQAEISRIGTLETTTRDINLLMLKITELEKDNKAWLAKNNKFFKTLVLTFVTEDMKTHSKSISFRKPKDWMMDLGAEEIILIKEFLSENDLNVRRIGVKYTNFLDVSGQKTLANEFSNLLEF